MIAPYLADACSKGGFFGIPHWWQFLDTSSSTANECIINFNIKSDIFAAALGILDIMLHIAGIIAVVMIMVAGVNYLLAIGNPQKITSSRRSIVHAIVGLAIVMAATAMVTFVGNSLS
ncbi:MAG TPA: hypothetical protein VFT49_03370 [Candidatus Saccharimonadales bacterium]|nr:hypothetical protein [Candidatus Saccharimonadales bacterium]